MARSDVDTLNTTFVQALEKGDAALMASVYAPDAHLLPPNHPRVTGPDIAGFWQAVLDLGVTGGRLETLDLLERDDVAVEEGRYAITVGPDVVDEGKYVVVHRRQEDGSWRWAVDVFNSDRPPGAEG
jgi:uncharacterized protein (TIGR02246 family)